jgi:hypothetical protein
MIVITTDTLDRIESIRDAIIAGIRTSELQQDLEIELRQSINQSIDTVVSNVLKANSTNNSVMNNNGDIFTA